MPEFFQANTKKEKTSQVTGLLQRCKCGDESAMEEIVSLIYDEIVLMARRQLNLDGRRLSVETTDLAHEVIIRVFTDKFLKIAMNRYYVIAAVSKAVNRVIVDLHRARAAQKRGGNLKRVSFEGLKDKLLVSEDKVDLSLALEEIKDKHPRKHDVVVYRFFGGMTNEEIAKVLNVTTRTVQNDLTVAKAYLSQIINN